MSIPARLKKNPNELQDHL